MSDGQQENGEGFAIRPRVKIVMERKSSVRICLVMSEIILFIALASIVRGSLGLQLLLPVAVMAGAVTLFGVVYEYKFRKNEHPHSTVAESSSPPQESSLATKAIKIWIVALVSVGAIRIVIFAVEARNGNLTDHEVTMFISQALFVCLFVGHAFYALKSKTRF